MELTTITISQELKEVLEVYKEDWDFNSWEEFLHFMINYIQYSLSKSHNKPIDPIIKEYFDKYMVKIAKTEEFRKFIGELGTDVPI